MALIAGLSSKPSVSVVSVFELFAGARSRHEEDRMARLLLGATIVPVGPDVARTGGQFIKHYVRSHGLDDFDALIAATAEVHNLPLVTLNVKHFPMFPKLKAPY
ncbi:MAG: type II toxin-antitoxin system VapC family toxin [Hyphomicrobiaceae bacterium]|nr:type II toxin-antitoxin system VapC family toxin [Hyphomicrobiaceae bacterium]